MITSRPVATYAYTDEEKQQAKSWLSSHGYPPTRAGAEQAYQDYMDGKIDVPEADAYMGKNQKNDIEEKKNPTVKTETKKDKQSKNTNKNSTTKQENSSKEQTNNSTTSAKESTTQGTTETTTTKVTTETKEQKQQKEEKKKKEQKETKKKRTRAAASRLDLTKYTRLCRPSANIRTAKSRMMKDLSRLSENIICFTQRRLRRRLKLTITAGLERCLYRTAKAHRHLMS